MQEAIVCFEFINQHVSTWISTLESLQSTVRSKRAEISRVPIPTRKLKRTGSDESIRPGSSHEGNLESMTSAPQAADLIRAPTNQDYNINCRKRKTASLLSAESVPTKYRSRSMIIVYYDSDIQKSFEGVVRHIGTARNNIRKARMANRMEAFSKGRNVSVLPVSRTGSTDVYTMVDGALETAQSLCERGAHQFLREGDCETEITGAKNSFEEAQQLSNQELATLRAEQQIQQQQQQEEEETKRLSMTSNGFKGDSSTGVLEPDDDDEPEENIEDLLKTLPRFGMRSTRSMART